MTGDMHSDQTSERVGAVLILMREWEPWEREAVRAALRGPAPLRLYVPPAGPIAWTPALEAEAVLQGQDGPQVVDGLSGDDVVDLGRAPARKADDTDVWPAGVVLAGQDDAE